MAKREVLKKRIVENEWSDPLEYLNHCLDLGKKFEKPPVVELVLRTNSADPQKELGAVDIRVSTAIQCYAPGAARMEVRIGKKSEEIRDSTWDGGHHTTGMHASYTWRITGVSRSAVHDNFHEDEHYNSEQQSLRYTEAKPDNILTPTGLSESQREILMQATDFANKQYQAWLEALGPEVRRRMDMVYPESRGRGEAKTAELEAKAAKLAQEIARYVLPIGYTTNLFHTRNETSLVRLFRASQLPSFSDESRYVIARMIEEVAKVDPTIMTEIRKPVTRGMEVVVDDEDIQQAKSEFDARLGENVSVMRGFGRKERRLLADAVRNVLGVPAKKMSDKEALWCLLDPERNELLADVFESGLNDPLCSALKAVCVTFETRMSHAADSQRERHRQTIAATPPIEKTYDGRPDYFVPMIIRENPALLQKYNAVMGQIYQNVDRCIAAGIPREQALLMLPSAHYVRVTESGNLFNWIHRFKQRLCYLAQEEIFFASIEQAEQLLGKIPEAEKVLAAPCKIRQAAGIRPRCPEGKRWCGLSVFGFKLEDYKKRRLI